MCLYDITSLDRLVISWAQHLAVLDCIRPGDPDGARESIRKNIEEGRNHVEPAVKEALARA